MAVRDDRGDVKQTTTGFRGPLMVQSLTSAKSKFLSLAYFLFFALYAQFAIIQTETSSHHRTNKPRNIRLRDKRQ